MRILHVTPYYKPAYAFGGVVRSVEGMARALVARGHDVTILTTDALDQRRRHRGPLDERIDGVRVLRRPNVSQRLRASWNLSTPRSMKKTAEAILPAIDVLHLHEFRTVENLLVTPVARQYNRPILLSPHGTLTLSTGRGGSKSAWDRILGPAVAARIDHVIALSESELAEAKALWRRFGARKQPTRFSVIPNGVQLEDADGATAAGDFRAQNSLGESPVVLYMGRLHKRKGVDVLIKAFMAADVDDARLLIVGPDDGMMAKLSALAGGDRRVTFTGYLEGAARLGALAAADVFGLPATGEGQPIAALEALAAGRPVVLSPGCNLDEAAEFGAGYVIEATVDAFAEKLRTLLTDAGLRRRMGAKARRLAKERYAWESIAERLERVYQALLNEPTEP